MSGIVYFEIEVNVSFVIISLRRVFIAFKIKFREELDKYVRLGVLV